MTEERGKWLVGLGLLILAAGTVLYLFGDKLGWLGNLPGDIRYEGENTRIYFPLTTMILLSILLSAIVTLLGRIFRG